jgi:hypothetical protein
MPTQRGKLAAIAELDHDACVRHGRIGPDRSPGRSDRALAFTGFLAKHQLDSCLFKSARVG